ncbi:MAG TPA: hypothetical protein VIO11_11300 [Candidatus Methanoperedens sp.]
MAIKLLNEDDVIEIDYRKMHLEEIKREIESAKEVYRNLKDGNELERYFVSEIIEPFIKNLEKIKQRRINEMRKKAQRHKRFIRFFKIGSVKSLFMSTG